MAEMQTIVIDVRGVRLSGIHRMTPARLHYAWSFGAAFAKSLWPLVNVNYKIIC